MKYQLDQMHLDTELQYRLKIHKRQYKLIQAIFAMKKRVIDAKIRLNETTPFPSNTHYYKNLLDTRERAVEWLINAYQKTTIQ